MTEQTGTTSGMMVEGFSLADLANMNTEQVRELTSLVPAVGIYRVRGVEVKTSQSEPQDNKPPLFTISFVNEILSAKPVNKEIDPESLVGRRLTDSHTLWPNQFTDMIGLVKGRYKTIGLANNGPRLGGVEGQEPGWLDGIVGHDYEVKVNHYIDKQGNTRARFTYLKAESSEGQQG